ncbi:MAG TPA: hypothetical protein VFL45_04535 [Gammaproteobacteria bacterium]|nr:hypothetical protein [Gammaproteobacteria bacterium]HET7587332.1 hypothetical protein [Gammaproteobacteria bacterium]
MLTLLAQGVNQVESVRHSGIGIASFATSIVFALLMFIAVAAADGLAALLPGDMAGSSIAAILLGASLAGSMISLRLGVGGVSQEARRKNFAVLGIVVSAGTILGIGLIMAVRFSSL